MARKRKTQEERLRLRECTDEELQTILHALLSDVGAIQREQFRRAGFEIPTSGTLAERAKALEGVAFIFTAHGPKRFDPGVH